MSTPHLGNEGTCKVGSDTLGLLKSWSLTVGAATVDASSIGDAWDAFLAGSKNWKGQATAMFDATDAGQADLVEGASVTLNLYPIGVTAGNKYFTGTAIVSEVQHSASRNSVIEVQFSFQGNGALSRPAAT